MTSIKHSVNCLFISIIFTEFTKGVQLSFVSIALLMVLLQYSTYLALGFIPRQVLESFVQVEETSFSKKVWYRLNTNSFSCFLHWLSICIHFRLLSCVPIYIVFTGTQSLWFGDILIGASRDNTNIHITELLIAGHRTCLPTHWQSGLLTPRPPDASICTPLLLYQGRFVQYGDVLAMQLWGTCFWSRCLPWGGINNTAATRLSCWRPWSQENLSSAIDKRVGEAAVWGKPLPTGGGGERWGP